MNIEKDIEIIRDRLNTENISPRPSYEDAHAALQRVRRAFAALERGLADIEGDALIIRAAPAIATAYEFTLPAGSRVVLKVDAAAPAPR